MPETNKGRPGSGLQTGEIQILVNNLLKISLIPIQVYLTK